MAAKHKDLELRMSDDEISFSDLLSYTNFVHAFSGTVASAFSITVLFPFETVRTRLQVDDHREAKWTLSVMRDIVRHEGFWALFRGWWSLILSNSIANYIYFYAFHCLRLFVLSSEGAFTVLSDLASGIFAGFTAVIISNPLWVVNTRLKLQGVAQGPNQQQLPQYSGIIDCLLMIVVREGVLTLWGGLLTSLLLATNPAINFVIYEALKRHALEYCETWINASILYFVFGGFSKLTATLLTYPLQLIQTRARAGIPVPKLLHLSMRQRVRILYRGVEAKLTQTVLTSALTLMTYEFIVSKIFALLIGSNSQSGSSHN